MAYDAPQLPTGEVEPLQTAAPQISFINPVPQGLPRDPSLAFLNSVNQFATSVSSQAFAELARKKQLAKQEQDEAEIAKAQFDYLKNQGEVPVDLRQQTLAYQQQYAHLSGADQARQIVEQLNQEFDTNPDLFQKTYGDVESAIASAVKQAAPEIDNDQYQRAGFLSVMNQQAARLMQKEAQHITKAQQVDAQRKVESNIFYYLRDNQVTLTSTLPETEYDTWFTQYGNQYGVPPDLLKAMARQESTFNPTAKSPKGALGLMQFMPATAKRFGVNDRTNPKQSIEGVAKFMRFLLDKFDNNIDLALAGYNAGENAVVRYGNKIPPYKETQNYVKKIKSYLTGKTTTKPNFKNKPEWNDFIESQALLHPLGKEGVQDATAKAIIRYAAEQGNSDLITSDYFEEIGLTEQYALMYPQILSTQLDIEEVEHKRQAELFKQKLKQDKYAVESGFQTMLLSDTPSIYPFPQIVDDYVNKGIISGDEGISWKGKWYNATQKQLTQQAEEAIQFRLDTGIIESIKRNDTNAYATLSANLSDKVKRNYIDKALTQELADLGIEGELTPELILSRDELLDKAIQFSAVSNVGSNLLTGYFNSASTYLQDAESFKKFDAITTAFRKVQDRNPQVAKLMVDSDNFDFLTINSEWLNDYKMNNDVRLENLLKFKERLSSEELRKLSGNVNPEKLDGKTKDLFDKAVSKLTEMDSWSWLGWIGGNNVDWYDDYNFTVEGGDARRHLARWLVTNMTANMLKYDDEIFAERRTLEDLPNHFGLYFNDNTDLMSRDRPSVMPADVTRNMTDLIDNLRETFAAKIREGDVLTSLPRSEAENVTAQQLRAVWDWDTNQLHFRYIDETYIPFFGRDKVLAIPSEALGWHGDIRYLYKTWIDREQNKITQDTQNQFAEQNRAILEQLKQVESELEDVQLPEFLY